MQINEYEIPKPISKRAMMISNYGSNMHNETWVTPEARKDLSTMHGHQMMLRRSGSVMTVFYVPRCTCE